MPPCDSVHRGAGKLSMGQCAKKSPAHLGTGLDQSAKLKKVLAFFQQAILNHLRKVLGQRIHQRPVLNTQVFG